MALVKAHIVEIHPGLFTGLADCLDFDLSDIVSGPAISFELRTPLLCALEIAEGYADALPPAGTSDRGGIGPIQGVEVHFIGAITADVELHALILADIGWDDRAAGQRDHHRRPGIVFHRPLGPH